MDELTPGQRRTAKARATRLRVKHERMAAELREAGWTVTPPADDDRKDGEQRG